MHRSYNSLLRNIRHFSLPQSLFLHSSINPQYYHHEKQKPSSQETRKNPESQNDLEFFSKTLIASPTQIHKLISSQSDPLLAKEIFDLASRQPNFRHSYSTFHTLILKLGNARQFSLMENLLSQLKRLRFDTTPGLFSRVICIYGDAHLPEKALKTFYSIIEYNCNPTSKHLNHVLKILVAQRNFIRPAFDLFRVAHKFEITPNVESYNILMRAFCYNDELSVAYKLFNEMLKRDILPDVESYRILMQALCRKSQVTKAMDLLGDMLNKGFVPDTLSYTSLLNSLCRKKKLKEAYKLLCRMKVKGCNPNITHYNTVILGLCREGRASDAIKVLDDMYSNGCLPNLVSYRTLVGGLIDQGMYDEAKKYMEEMILKGFSPHFSITQTLIEGLCNVGRIEEASALLGELLKHGEAPHAGTWQEVISKICEAEEMERLDRSLDEVIKVDLKPHTRIVEAGVALEEYLIKKIHANSWKA
ncbi:pentatricopeptide repeat-containing protein At4g01400, mitochondrial [Beta vulgaris subsp. vulgaris]|uniref:pentatricopeptide repeat-containing protein At4g01400, mitochondrial n=1 Tax=Beta vulgaris subsp. vulgaris TaxID=3555 RepID=UPI002037539A|nr:pentatricopeptide repeat-containing protein At4g01400, mitochondrial [Beta vulgaris subsp. vulgaris]XP_010689162.2 pentatricopeptide repeat-containing protein At4g01400, mitochondrial [Beta vulgaris subsp. vulgaris]